MARWLAMWLVCALVPLMAADLRLGIIGLDISHVVVFTRLLNDEASPNHVPGARIVAAYKGGSPDMKLSADRVDGFTAELRDRFHVRIVDDIPSLCRMVDGVMLESLDGRAHAEQARLVLQAHKRLFIDKPLTARLSDALQIAQWGRETGTAWFSASQLRFVPAFQKLRSDPELGPIYGLESYGRAVEEPLTPGLFYYGIHAVEALYTVMGPGCGTVTTTANTDFDLVVGQWQDGRLGTVRGIRKGDASFGLLAFGAKAVRFVPSPGFDVSYPLALKQIVRFFETGEIPVSNAESVEIIAFMEAAQKSRQMGGVPVRLAGKEK
jgi:hypothetical protein